MGRTFAAVIHGQSLRGVECGLNPYLWGSGSQKVRPCGGVRGKGVTRGPCAKCGDLQKRQWRPSQGVTHGSWGRPRSGVWVRGVTRGPRARGGDLQKSP